MEEIKADTQNPEGQLDSSLSEPIDNTSVIDATSDEVLLVEQSDVISSPIEQEVTNNKEELLIEEVAPKMLVTLKKEVPIEVEKKTVAVVTEVKDESDENKITGDLFVNYDSDFHKNQKTILQRIRQFKMTPKTSISFILILIVITFSGIGIMMKIDPKNHSLDNYKANILALIGIKTEIKTLTGTIISANTGVIDTGTGEIGTGVIDTGTGETSTGVIDTGTGETSTGSLEEKEEFLVREKWLTISPEVVANADGSVSYIYKGKTYTQEELQEELRREVKLEISKKTKDYLNKVYIHQ